MYKYNKEIRQYEWPARDFTLHNVRYQKNRIHFAAHTTLLILSIALACCVWHYIARFSRIDRSPHSFLCKFFLLIKESPHHSRPAGYAPFSLVRGRAAGTARAPHIHSRAAISAAARALRFARTCKCKAWPILLPGLCYDDRDRARPATTTGMWTASAPAPMLLYLYMHAC